MLKKIKPLIINKIWGHEKLIYSSYEGKETYFEDSNEKVIPGPIVKIIETTKPLSVQVHPDDEMALRVENQPQGKHESWYILKSQDSKIILGMKSYDEKLIRETIDSVDFLDNLKELKTKVGEFYDIPAGLVHGLGADIAVLEVQQCSDTTYRYYDYNRLENGSKRELHLDKAIKAQKELPYDLKEISTEPLSYKNKVATQTFYFKPSLIKKGSLVIDLKTHDSYWVEEDVVVELDYFAVIKW